MSTPEESEKPESTEPTVKYEVEKKVGTITINRPEVMNALRWEEMSGIVDSINEAEKNPKVRVIRLKSAGNRAFIAGLDLKMVSKLGPEDIPKLLEFGNGIVRTCLFAKKPIVAQIQGAAVGWGCILSLAADIVIVGENPKTFFGLPEIDVGIYPATGALTLALLNVGLRHAKQMLLIPKKYSPEEFKTLGVVHEIVPMEELDAFTFKFCRTMAKKPKQILYLTKAVMNNIHYGELEKNFKKEAAAIELTKQKDDDENDKFIKSLWE
jgi:enoyl-CoA hydratase/carnithine racemase